MDSSQYPAEDTLRDEIVSLSSYINAAEYRFLVAIEEYDRLEYWDRWGSRHMVAWLGWHCHMGKSTAREHVRVAKALPRLPLLSAAMQRGELSYSKARAITRVADPAMEETWLHYAEFMTAEQLNRLIAGFRKVDEDEDDTAKDHIDRRSCSYYWDDSGAMIIKARLAPEDGALFVNALETAKHDVPPANPEGKDDINADLHRNQADALIEMARRSLRASTNTTPESVEVVLHADARLMASGADELTKRQPSTLSRVARGPHLSAKTVQRMICDSPLRVIAELDGEPLNIGRRSRKWTRAQRIAIYKRDNGYFWPGCSSTRANDIHHIDTWASGGETALDNGIEACRTHHRAIHEGGYTLERRHGGGASIVRPDGTKVGDVPPRAPAAPQQIEGLFPSVDPMVSESKWAGTPIDLGWQTANIFAHREWLRAQGTSAEAPERPAADRVSA